VNVRFWPEADLQASNPLIRSEAAASDPKQPFSRSHFLGMLLRKQSTINYKILSLILTGERLWLLNFP
jgi:hypothetical protein